LNNAVVLSPLSYTAICDVVDKVEGNLSASDISRLVKRFGSTCSSKLEDIANSEKVIFPCKLT